MFKLWIMVGVAAIFGTYFAFEASLVEAMWNGDATKLSFVIVVLTLQRYIAIGLLVYRYEDEGIETLELEEAYSTAELMSSLGMVGTLIGFIAMLSSFAGVDLSDVTNIKQLFELATGGMSTALYTTLAGLVGGTLVRSAYQALEFKAKREGTLVKVK